MVRTHFRCIKSESGIKRHVGKGSGSEQTDLNSKPHSEERFYYFLFLYVKDQISDTLLLVQYILLKKKSFCNSPSPHPHPQWAEFLTREEAGRDYQGVGRLEEGAGKLSFPCD